MIALVAATAQDCDAGDCSIVPLDMRRVAREAEVCSGGERCDPTAAAEAVGLPKGQCGRHFG